MDLEKARKEYQVLEEKKKASLKARDDDKTLYLVGGKRGQVIVDKQKAICKELKESFRLTEITRRVIAWRKKAISQREIKTIIEQYQIPIENIALAEWGNEKWDFDFGTQYDNRFLPEVYKESCWDTRKKYIYGGPKDPIQIFFKHVPKIGYEILGVFLNKDAFPKKGIFSLFAKGLEKRSG